MSEQKPGRKAIERCVISNIPVNGINLRRLHKIGSMSLFFVLLTLKFVTIILWHHGLTQLTTHGISKDETGMYPCTTTKSLT